MQQRWPSIRGPNGWLQQYRTLTDRVRQFAREAATQSFSSPAGWWFAVEYVVRPVLSFPSIAAALGPHGQFRRAGRSAPVIPVPTRCVFVLVAEFAGDQASQRGMAALRKFATSPASIARAGCGKLLGSARSLRDTYVFRGSCGSFASAASATYVGKLARAVRVKRELVVPELLATLESEPRLTKLDASEITAGTLSGSSIVSV